MESGQACFGLVCVRGSPHNRRWDSFSPVDRSGKWVGWVGPDLEIYFRVCMRYRVGQWKCCLLGRFDR